MFFGLRLAGLLVLLVFCYLCLPMGPLGFWTTMIVGCRETSLITNRLLLSDDSMMALRKVPIANL